LREAARGIRVYYAIGLNAAAGVRLITGRV
jgi:hypothetical protein